MIKVTIEADGQEKRVFTGEMVNMAVVDKDDCYIAIASQPTKQGITAANFIKSLAQLVQRSLKAFAHGDRSIECMLNFCFSSEMMLQTDEYGCMKESKEDDEQENKKDVEHHGVEELLNILRDVFKG